MLKLLSLLVSLFILVSCGRGNHQKNLAELDEIYGKCDNPMRSNEYNNHNKNSRIYRACKAKEMSGGTSLFDLEDSFKDTFGIGGGNKSDVLVVNSVNPLLWRSSLDVTKDYPLKIADNQGGYIETDWIYGDGSLADKNRCLIKIRVLSQDLISTGVQTNFICETKNNNNWANDEKDYFQQEKQITLSILERASELAQSNL